MGCASPGPPGELGGQGGSGTSSSIIAGAMVSDVTSESSITKGSVHDSSLMFPDAWVTATSRLHVEALRDDRASSNRSFTTASSLRQRLNVFCVTWKNKHT